MEREVPCQRRWRSRTKVFPPMLVNMVEAGETSGSIDKSLERMAIQFEKEAKLKGMMKRSMMYPMVLGVVALVILIVMLTYVIPNYMEMFEGYDFDMPALTLAIMHMGDFVKKSCHPLSCNHCSNRYRNKKLEKNRVRAGVFWYESDQDPGI